MQARFSPLLFAGSIPVRGTVRGDPARIAVALWMAQVTDSLLHHLKCPNKANIIETLFVASRGLCGMDSGDILAPSLAERQMGP